MQGQGVRDQVSGIRVGNKGNSEQGGNSRLVERYQSWLAKTSDRRPWSHPEAAVIRVLGSKAQRFLLREGNDLRRGIVSDSSASPRRGLWLNVSAGKLAAGARCFGLRPRRSTCSWC